MLSGSPIPFASRERKPLFHLQRSHRISLRQVGRFVIIPSRIKWAVGERGQSGNARTHRGIGEREHNNEGRVYIWHRYDLVRRFKFLQYGCLRIRETNSFDSQSELSRSLLHHSRTGIHLQPFYLYIPSYLLLSGPHTLDASLVGVLDWNCWPEKDELRDTEGFLNDKVCGTASGDKCMLKFVML